MAGVWQVGLPKTGNTVSFSCAARLRKALWRIGIKIEIFFAAAQRSHGDGSFCGFALPKSGEKSRIGQ